MQIVFLMGVIIGVLFTLLLVIITDNISVDSKPDVRLPNRHRTRKPLPMQKKRQKPWWEKV
jgi:hypothetical protein